MKRSTYFLGFATGLAGVAVLSLMAQAPATTQGKSAPKAATTKTKATTTAAKGKAAPKTAWGTPDLQGTWFVTEDVPLERSAANANKEFLTDAEVAESDARKGVSPGRNTRDSKDAAQDVSGAYNAVFNSVLKTGKRTSRIIDPPDGRIPPTVNAAAQGQGRPGGGPGAGAAKGGGAPGAGAAKGGGAPAGAGGGAGRGGLAVLGVAPGQNDNPETAAQSPRCLGVAMPFLPLNTAFAQGTVMQIVQGPKSLGIYMEDDHAGGGNRIIHMGGSHPPANVKLYLGDSRGHWEGNTLVVETTNFSTGFRGSNPDTYKMTERFTRLGPNDLRREITFEDPKTWTKPWTLLIDMGKTSDDRHMIFDSACHEGNYGMTGLLVGSRREEQNAAKGKSK
jgi:hypothetical protein